MTCPKIKSWDPPRPCRKPVTTGRGARTPNREPSLQSVPPDGGYGWVCVLGVFLINAHTWGVSSSYAVVLSYYLSHQVFPDASPLLYAITGGLSASCGLLAAPLITYLLSRGGTRLVMNLGVVFEAVSFIGVSFARQTWHMVLSQGVCFGIGMNLLFVGSIGIIPQWFRRRRGIAMGIASAGSGIGGLIYSLAVGAMIPRLGLAWTFRSLAIITFVVNFIAGNALRDRNQHLGARTVAFQPALLKRPELVLFLGWGMLINLGYIALLFSIANYAQSVGLGAHEASIVAALLNLGQGIGRPCVGLFSDRFGPLNMTAAATFLCGILCLVFWIFARSLAVLCVFAILCGSVAGTFFATVSPVLAEVVGLQELPSALSINWLFVGPALLAAEPIAVAIRNPQASGHHIYLGVQVFAGCMYLGAAACLWAVRGWKASTTRSGEKPTVVADMEEINAGPWNVGRILDGMIHLKIRV